MKILNFLKRFFCKHKQYEEGWFIQQVKFRECKNCGLRDYQMPNYTKIK